MSIMAGLDPTGATQMFLGGQEADAIYAGGDLVWKKQVKRTIKWTVETKDPADAGGNTLAKPATTEGDGSVWIVVINSAGDGSTGMYVRFFIAYQGAWWPISQHPDPGHANEAAFMGTTDGISPAAFNWPGIGRDASSDDKAFAWNPSGQYLMLDAGSGVSDSGKEWDQGWPPGVTNANIIGAVVYDSATGKGDGVDLNSNLRNEV